MGEAQETYVPATGAELSALPEAKSSETMDVKDGETITLEPKPVRAMIGGKAVAMLGYNGQIPGPLLRVEQGSTFTVLVKNAMDLPTTVHWHGVRLENRFDGVPDMTQEPIAPGGTFRYTVTVPDSGFFWYHPHVREDLQQDLGLYGGLLVVPTDQEEWGPVNEEEVLIVDDLLMGREGIVPFGGEEANFALMGRFGNTFFVNGAERYERTVKAGTTMRVFLLNAANTRTFRLEFPGADVKLIGRDNGIVDHQEELSAVDLGPSERAIVEVQYGEAGTYPILHESPVESRELGTVTVTAEKASPQYAMGYAWAFDPIGKKFDLSAYPISKTLVLDVAMHGMSMGHIGHGQESEDGIEWEEEGMLARMNAIATSAMVEWKLVDQETGAENEDIQWKFRKGEVVRIRIINKKNSAHPMQHPIHLHGQRFLVLSDNGKENANLSWKDTVQVPAGHEVDILVPMDNPGTWMMHCHIAEHLTAGMMGSFMVE